MWGLPGGYAEMGETPQQAALREGSEEIGTDLRKPELQRVAGRLVLRDVLARLKCSPKDTLHAWLEEWFTFVHSLENPALEGLELGSGDPEVLERGWMGARDDARYAMPVIPDHKGIKPFAKASWAGWGRYRLICTSGAPRAQE
jgi:8-oxo-dGTP pyrophosphatase MutT (NUDIX family)